MRRSGLSNSEGEIAMSLGKRLGAEFFGTFWLVFGGCGSAVLAAAFPQLGIGFARAHGGAAEDAARRGEADVEAIGPAHEQAGERQRAVGAAAGTSASRVGAVAVSRK